MLMPIQPTVGSAEVAAAGDVWGWFDPVARNAEFSEAVSRSLVVAVFVVAVFVVAVFVVALLLSGDAARGAVCAQLTNVSSAANGTMLRWVRHSQARSKTKFERSNVTGV